VKAPITKLQNCQGLAIGLAEESTGWHTCPSLLTLTQCSSKILGCADSRGSRTLLTGFSWVIIKLLNKTDVDMKNTGQTQGWSDPKPGWLDCFA